MSIVNNLQSGFAKMQDNFGKVCRFKYYSNTIGSVWDDEATLSLSGASVILFSGTSNTPNINGSYSINGTFNGSNVYTRLDGQYNLWWNNTSTWIVSSKTGVPDTPQWFRISTNNLGSYTVTTQGTGSVDAVQGGSNMPQWFSGIVLPLNSSKNSRDFELVEQGKLAPNDQRLFVSGNINLGGSDIQLKIQLGSPTGDQFTTIQGDVSYEASDNTIFKKAFIRRLTNGSLVGE